jgi:hypothetical protein
VYLASGDYTLFDSTGSNRSKGYAVKIHVTSSPASRAKFGKPCVNWFVPGIVDRFWVKGESCHIAEKVAQNAISRWQSRDFSYATIASLGYTCTVSPFSAVGLKFTCLKGDKRVTLAG